MHPTFVEIHAQNLRELSDGIDLGYTQTPQVQKLWQAAWLSTRENWRKRAWGATKG